MTQPGVWLCSRGHTLLTPGDTRDGKCVRCWLDAENEYRGIHGLPLLIPSSDPVLVRPAVPVMLPDVRVCRRGHYKWQQPSGQWTCRCHTAAQARYRERRRATA